MYQFDLLRRDTLHCAVLIENAVVVAGMRLFEPVGASDERPDAAPLLCRHAATDEALELIVALQLPPISATQMRGELRTGRCLVT